MSIDERFNERTNITDDYLSQCVNELKNVIMACESTMNGRSFSQSCRDVNLNPQKTTYMLQYVLMRCSELSTDFSERDIDIYDGYEKFYIFTFGERALSGTKLPADYKESVMHVLEHTGMDPDKADLAMQKFGLGKYEGHQQTYKAIADTRNISPEQVKDLFFDIKSEVRIKGRADIMKAGLKEYNRIKDPIPKRMTAGTEKQPVRNKTTLTDSRYETAAVELLKTTPVSALDLDPRSMAGLKCMGIRSIYDAAVFQFGNSMDDLQTDVRSACSAYAEEKLGISGDQFQGVVSENDFTDAVNRLGADDGLEI